MLPATVAIISATFSPERRGRALGTMGGAAAVAAALGPTIGGLLTSAFSWRAVLLINVPLAVATVLLTLRHVAAGEPSEQHQPVDTIGTALVSVALIGIVFGLSQSQPWGWSDPGVWLPLVVAAAAAGAFVIRERRTSNQLVDFALMRRRNYLGASLSQLLSGIGRHSCALRRRARLRGDVHRSDRRRARRLARAQTLSAAARARDGATQSRSGLVASRCGEDLRPFDADDVAAALLT